MQIDKKNMIESQLKPEGISCQNTINCISRVNREDFVPEEFRNLSYAEYDIPLRNEYFMLKPLMTAKILQLLNIDKDGTPSMKLGPKMGMEPRSLTRMIKSLEEKGWIEKRMDNSDKRMVNIHLTETGKKMRNLSRSSVIKFNKTIQEKINNSELKTCFKVLGEINQLIDNNKIF